MDSSEETCLMKTHFLKPYVTSIDGPVAELPRNRFSVSSSELKDSYWKISFTGFWSPHAHFNSWAQKMEPLHEPTWRKAGIFEAIKASTYKIRKNRSVIISLVEKWCHETKSFIFPWGEATITLEDVMVLLGFSVLGSPVFAPLESLEMRDSVETLEKVRQKLRNKLGCVSQVVWMSSFNGSVLEHEAFLALWLSHFVFPEKDLRSCILEKVLPIAVRLARGEKIALASSILASIYRDFGQIQAFARDKSSTQKLEVNSLFKLVQVWTWERFRNARVKAIQLHEGEPRIARWSRVIQIYERFSFDDFEWRPYAKPLENWNPPRFYVEEGKWVTVDDSLDDELVSFARCLRVSQLVGIGFVEDYYPHRVAMQFGLSQDLPGLVTDHSNFTEKEAWDDYSKPLDGSKLYVPSRLATSSVTTRYRDWWLKSVSGFLSSQESHDTFNARNKVDDDDDAPPKVMPLTQVLQKLGVKFPANFKRSRKLRTEKNMRWGIKKCKIGDCSESDSREVPLSELFREDLVERTSEHLRNKRVREDDNDSSFMDCYDNITISAMIKSSNKNGGDGSKSCGDKRRRFQVVDSDDSEPCEKLDSITIEQRGEEKDKEIASNAQKKMDICDDNNMTTVEVGSKAGDETTAQQELEQRNEESVAEETGNKVETIKLLIPSKENNSSDPPVGLNGGIFETAASPPEIRQNCDDDIDVNGSSADKKAMIDEGTKGEEGLLDENVEKKMQIHDDEVSVNGISAEKKTTVEDDTMEVESLVHEGGEAQRVNDDDDERWKQRKLAIEELGMNLEARMMKVEMTLAMIGKWITTRNQIQTGVST